MNPPKCNVDECPQPVKAKGVCGRHYFRLRKYGLPTAGPPDRFMGVNVGRPARRLFYLARQRSKEFGVPFTITPYDVIIPDTCPILGIPLRAGVRVLHDASPSIDRVIPSKGYTPENIVVISLRANRIKNDATAEELRRVADFIDARVK